MNLKEVRRKGEKHGEREDLPASSTLFKQISRALICEIHRDPMDQRAAFHYLSLELTRAFDRNQDQVKKEKSNINILRQNLYTKTYL